MNLNAFMALAAPKYAFLALIYLLLFLIVGAVRREMQQHLKAAEQPAFRTPGQLKLIKSGSDAQWQPGQHFPLEPETTLGAATDNTICLHDQFVSSHHARLKWDGVKWWLEDLGSTNGTFLNGQRCPPHQPQRVPAAGLLRLGDMVFELQG